MVGSASETGNGSGAMHERRARVARRALAWWVTGVLFVGILPVSSAIADPFGIQAFDGQVTAGPAPNPQPDPSDPADPANFAAPFTQAGGHPYAVSTQIRLNRKTDPVNGPFWPSEPVKDIIVDAPPGLTGNPTVVRQCSMDHIAVPDGKPTCEPASQVGVVQLIIQFCFGPGLCAPAVTSNVALYSMIPPPDVPARLAFSAGGTIVTLDAELRSGSDYGLSIHGKDAGEALPIIGANVTLWGTPSDSSHDTERSCPGELPPPDGPAATDPACGVPYTRPDPQAFLTMPTACPLAGQGLTTTMRTSSWFNPTHFETASFESHLPPGLPDLLPGGEPPLVPPAQWGAPQGPTGCDQVPFDPSFTAKPETPSSPGTSGWTFDLTIPQDDIANPDTIAQGALKQASVTLPEGVRVSPAAADGLGACSPSQIALHSASDPTCPSSSKIGSMTIDTPLLDQALDGAIYLAKPFDNPSGSLLAVYLVAKGPGVVVKLPGSVTPDPATGRISTTFDNNPQAPFSRVHLEFFGGPRAALANPQRCGTYTTTAAMTSWSGKTVTSNSTFTTSHDGKGAPCPRSKFDPKLVAGTMTSRGDVPNGGSYSSFSLTLSRDDEDEELAAIQRVHMPNGLLAKLAGVPLCSPTDVTAGTCGERSRIGSVTAAAGVGPNPFAVKGSVYIGGPYKGAPFSLLIAVPVVAGPFDLGTVAVRSALFVNRKTADLDISTDPLPTILQGIPLQVRVVNVTIDRRDFILNPTSCNAKRISATVRSTLGTLAGPSSRFQVADCRSLPLRPRLRLLVGARNHTRRGVSTPFTTILTQTPHQANLKSVSVLLPLSLNARLNVVNNACTMEQFDSGRCAKARAGTAVAVTPLLSHALRGGVYLVKDPNRPPGSLPNLIVALRGQVDFDLVGRVKIPATNQLGTRFGTIPDVPITRFKLRLVAGKNGPLGAAADLCTPSARRAVAHVAFRGQNGALFESDQRLEVHGCGDRSRRDQRHHR